MTVLLNNSTDTTPSDPFRAVPGQSLKKARRRWMTYALMVSLCTYLKATATTPTTLPTKSNYALCIPTFSRRIR
jgi:hypothetical protein